MGSARNGVWKNFWGFTLLRIVISHTFCEDITKVKTPGIKPFFKDVRNWKMRKDNLDLWIEQEIAKKVEECKQAGL